MAYANLKLERGEGVARLTLNRPDAANALNLELAQELMDAAIELDADASVRAVVLGATGRMFCAGGDLQAFRDAGDALPAGIKRVTTHLHAALSVLARMDAPVIAAVQGAAAGAGFSLLCACDLAVAARSAKFTMAYTRAGLAPDGSSTWFLPRLIGARRTAELMLTNRTLTAEEARDWGIVNEVVDDGDLEGRVTELATGLAAGPTRAFGQVKRLLQLSSVEGFESQMEHESRAISAASRTADAAEGIAAFFEKRAPKFSGR